MKRLPDILEKVRKLHDEGDFVVHYSSRSSRLEYSLLLCKKLKFNIALTSSFPVDKIRDIYPSNVFYQHGERPILYPFPKPYIFHSKSQIREEILREVCKQLSNL